ncbi:MAG: MBL fold metallo-hydrolase [Solirubrobacteraceae bacterium]|nr:MBL fold metallo-hydrolase [Solirubrobacteraceae bacterium]
MTAPSPTSPAVRIAADAGIHRLSLPTPFPVGPVNAWFVDDDPPTLVDAGPAGADALWALEQGLRALGRRVDDLARIVVTHEHADHVGLAALLQERTGAEVVALDVLAPRLRDLEDHGRREARFLAGAAAAHGVPAVAADAVATLHLSHHQWAGRQVGDVVPVADGDAVAFAGRRLRVVHRPGHSATDTLLVDDARGIVLGGDHLLGHVPSVPLLTCRPAALHADAHPATAADRAPALPRYLDGISRTAAEDPRLVLGGHGSPVVDVPTLVATRRRSAERRARRILGLLGPDEAATAHDLASRLWGDVVRRQVVLCLSETLGSLDLLAADGAVTATADGGDAPITWRRAA